MLSVYYFPATPMTDSEVRVQFEMLRMQYENMLHIIRFQELNQQWNSITLFCFCH